MRHNLSPTTLTASAMITGVFSCAALAVSVGRPLYADGAYYLLSILASRDLPHFAWTRIGATLITQTPLILAMRVGVSDITWLAYIFGAGLFLPPVLAFTATTLLTRHDPLLFTVNAVIIFACYFPTSMLIMGEFHILYALAWCGFVLLITGKADKVLGSVVVVMLAIAIAASYEISVLACPLLMLASGWRIRETGSPLARGILLLAMAPLGAGVMIGALGILAPRDPTNAGQFLQALRWAFGNVTLLGISGLVAAAGAASLLAPRDRRVAAAGIAAVCLGFGWELARLNNGPALGDSFSQRAQVVPIILGAVLVCGVYAWRRARSTAPRHWRFNPWPLVLPGLMVVMLDVHDSLGWLSFLDRFCTVLTDVKEDAAAFPGEPVAQGYGWPWTYPTLSLLLRAPGSVTLVRYPTPNLWQPFDPDGPLPDIASYKTAGGMCQLVSR